MMVNVTVNVCRLCLKAAVYSDVINSSEKDFIQIVIPQVDLDIGDYHRICKNCAKLLKQSFDFKSKCLEIEDGIHDFKKEGQIPIDLEKSLGIKEVTKSLRICRTCSECLKNNAYVELNSRNGLRSIFKKCLPEMDIELTVEPVICLSCHGTLKKLFNLITLCEKNEEKIRFYFESSNKNWIVAWCKVVQYELNQVLDCNQIVIRENNYFSMSSTNIKEADLLSKNGLEKNSCEINKDHAQTPVIQNIYQISNVTGTDKKDSTSITETSKVPEVLPGDNINNDIYIVSYSDENDCNLKATETSNKSKSRGNKIKLINSVRVTDDDITSKVEHSRVASEKESNENIVLNDTTYFSYSANTNTEGSMSNCKPNSMNKKVGNENLDNSKIQYIVPTKILSGSNKKDFTSSTEGLLDGNVNNEIYVVSDSDENCHNTKATETSKKRKTRGNKINLTRVTDGETSSNDDSDCSWVDSGNVTDSSGEWFSTPKKCKRTKKPKLVPTKQIQLKNSIFCKYCFFSTTSTLAINRHITNCPSSPFRKNLPKISGEGNGTLQNSKTGILSTNLPGSLGCHGTPSVQENNIVIEIIEDLSEETTTENSTPNTQEGKENVETVQSEVSNYARESSTLNSKDSKRNKQQLKTNYLKSILTNSNKILEDCFIVATEGTCIAPKPSKVNSKRSRRREYRIKRLKLVTKFNKKQSKDGHNVTTNGTSTDLEPSTLNFEGIPEEQDQTNKTFSIVKDAANIIENCTEKSPGRNSCESIVNKDCLAVITEGISVEEPIPSRLNSKTIHGEGGPIVTTERISTEPEPTSCNFTGNTEEQDETNKYFSIPTDNAKNVENGTSNCTRESTGINACELFINKDCLTKATEGTSAEESKCKKNNNKQLKDGLTVTTEGTSSELEPFTLNFKGTSEEQDQAFSILTDAANITQKKTSNGTGETIGTSSCELFINKDGLTVTTEETSMEEPVEQSNIAMTENVRMLEDSESRLKNNKQLNRLTVTTEETCIELELSGTNQDQTNRAYSILKDTFTKKTSNCTEETRGRNSCELITNKYGLTVATAGISVQEAEPSGLKSKDIQRECVLIEREKLKPVINKNSKQLQNCLLVTTEGTSTEPEPSNLNFKGTSKEQDQKSRSFSILKDAANNTEKKTTNGTRETIGRNSCELFINKDCLTVTPEETSVEEPVEKSMTENVRTSEGTESRLKNNKRLKNELTVETKETCTELSSLNFKETQEKQDQTNRAFNILRDTLKKKTSKCTEESRGRNSCKLITNKYCLIVAAAEISVQEAEPSGLKSKDIQRKCVLIEREKLKPVINNNSKQLKNCLLVTTEGTSTELEPSKLNFKGTLEEQQTCRVFSVLEDTANIAEKIISNCTGESSERNSCEPILNKDYLTVSAEGISMDEPEPSTLNFKGIQREDNVLEKKNLDAVVNNNKKLLSVLEVLMCDLCKFNTRSVLKMVMHQKVHVPGEMRVNYSTGYSTVNYCVTCAKQISTMTKSHYHTKRCLQKSKDMSFLFRVGDVLHCTKCYFDSEDPKIVVKHLDMCGHIRTV